MLSYSQAIKCLHVKKRRPGMSKEGFTQYCFSYWNFNLDLGTLELYYERLGEELEINDGFITGVIEK